MVTQLRRVTCVVISALTFSVAAADGMPVTNGKPAGYRQSPVKTVTITLNAAKNEVASGSDAEDCSKWVLTESHVRFFFRNARQVSSDRYVRALNWSSCFAEGAVVFHNGSEAEWRISGFGKGSVIFTMGKSKGEAFPLYCAKCEAGWNFPGLIKKAAS